MGLLFRSKSEKKSRGKKEGREDATPSQEPVSEETESPQTEATQGEEASSENADVATENARSGETQEIAAARKTQNEQKIASEEHTRSAGNEGEEATEEEISTPEEVPREDTTSSSEQSDEDVTLGPALNSVDGSKQKSLDRSLFKALLGSLYDAVLVIDAKGAVLEQNPRAEQFFQYKQGEFWNKNCSELIGAITPRVLGKIQQHVQSGRFTVVNADCKRKDGSTFPSEIAISKFNMLHGDDLLFSIRNLEKHQKGKEEHGMETEAFRNAGAGVAICDLEGVIESANPAFLHLLQYKQEQEVLESNLRDLCHSEKAADDLLSARNKKETWIGRVQLTRANGWPHEFLATSVQSNDKESQHLVLTFTPMPKKVITS